MSSASSNVTCSFIDLATIDDLERKWMYGGQEAIAYFVRETRKATWFAMTPVLLTNSNGTPAFGSEFSVNISRGGDYFLNAWLRVKTPAITLQPTNQFAANGRIRWTRNFMHNLIESCTISFNDLVAEKFDNYFLDFWAAFTIRGSKQVGYDNMIGNLAVLTQPSTSLPERNLNLPLPLFFSRDSGVSLPTAAIPYNDMRINFKFRDWKNLLILDNTSATTGSVTNSVVPADTDITTVPSLSAQVWGHYAVVSCEERKLMGCGCREIIIEQVQAAPLQIFNPVTNAEPSFDLRFSYSVKALFFGVQNTTFPNVWSNYTTASPLVSPNSVVYEPASAWDPIDNVSIRYENTSKFSNIGADYFSLVVPWYFARSIPAYTGYHLYSYALNVCDVDPVGGTNYGKLANVSIQIQASAAAKAAGAGTGPAGSGSDFPQTFKFLAYAVSNNVLKVSGGTVGFPNI